MEPLDPIPQRAVTKRVSNSTKLRMEYQINENYGEFLRSLSEETDIRILVGSASGTGHQSSAIMILKLITRLWRSVSFGHIHEKTVHLIYYYDSNLVSICNTENTLKEKEPYINGIRVVLEKELPGFFPATYRYGFAGAFDDPGNLAKKCNVKYFLRLQPLFWRHMDEIHYNDWSGEEEDITTSLLNYEFMKQVGKVYGALPVLDLLSTIPDFRCLGYFHQLPAEPDWGGQDPAVGAIRTILQGAEADKFELCITYSIGKGTVFPNSTSEILFNLTSGFVCSKNRGSIQKNHVVILNFTPSNVMLPEEIVKVTVMLMQPAQRKSALENMDNVFLKESIEAAERSVTECGIYQEFEHARLNFHCLNIGDNQIDNILGNNDGFHVILVNIPTRQEKTIFDYSLTKVTLFSVFEGSGTASVAGTIGKPYLKYNLLYPQSGPHYLNFHNGDEVLSENNASLCQRTANCVACSFADWKNIKVIEELPCLMLSRFIALYKTGERPLNAFFSAAGRFYNSESNTRLFIALGIFNMLIKNKKARKNKIEER